MKVPDKTPADHNGDEPTTHDGGEAMGESGHIAPEKPDKSHEE